MSMKRLWIVGIACAGLAVAAHAAGRPLAPGDVATRVSHGKAGEALTGPSTADPASVVARFLRGSGHGEATVRSLSKSAESVQYRKDRTYLRMSQEVAGLRVHDADLKAVLDRDGRLLSVVENLSPVGRRSVDRAVIDESTALGKALVAVGVSSRIPELVGRRGETTRFHAGELFSHEPTVTRVAVPTADGGFEQGFLVETWQRRGNQLHEVLVSGRGDVLDVLSRTNDDSYKVFLEDPTATPQTVEPGDAAWLFAGDHSSIDIAGNNVHGYLDRDNDNAPDAGGTTISDGNFLSTFDAFVQPTEPVNQNVAVQNLFFLNNVIHDTLYAAGFDEVAGNFQEDNFGLGGRGGDSVNAEAQDGGGTDNANFATPRDGRNPTMQMYLWSGLGGTHEVVVSAPAGIAGSYAAGPAEFGPQLDATGRTGDVVLVDDGSGTTTDACESIQNDVNGKIALIDRGTCAFVDKVSNAQAAGAIGVIVANNAGEDVFTMGGTIHGRATTPALLIGQTDGDTIKNALGSTVTATLRTKVPAPIQIDGDLDSDIVWHEYGHGLTWRMIGRMDGAMAGAIGEGMSDVLSVIVHDDPVVGEYSFSNPAGIRSESYDAFSRTYGDFSGSEVHFDGEIYGAIGWRVWKNFESAAVSKETVLGYLVDGMNFTPSQPTFEQMRDGVLAAIGSNNAHACLVWEAFAHYGVGVGASGSVKGPSPTIVESFTVPNTCP